MIRRLHVLMLPSPPGGYACMTTGNRCESPLLVAYAGVCESTILHGLRSNGMTEKVMSAMQADMDSALRVKFT
nr:hypothetical protein CFP56_57043 [Quercus suber]